MGNELEILLSAVREAGLQILHLQKNELAISRKTNNDIVTKADLLVDEILSTRLRQAFPSDGWLSEESVDDLTRLNASRVWVVDPVDGTKEFAAGIPEYAISVALIENGQPILAAVFNPATNELFHALKNGGAWQDKRRLHCTHTMPNAKLLLLASRSEDERGEWDGFRRKHAVTVVGSIAYKLALVAAGKADATFSLGPKSEWDIAAGVLLVTEAGGVVTNQRKEAFVFNNKEILVDGIVATAPNINDDIFNLISTLT
jgi:myo-inositol-1(or 4)-monophosphatase